MRSARAFGVTGIITTFRNAASENGVLARAAWVHWIMPLIALLI